MRKIFIFLFFIFTVSNVIAQTYNVKITLCTCSYSEFQKILENTPNDIAKRFGSEILTFKIKDKETFERNNMKKISDFLKANSDMTETQRKAFVRDISSVKNNPKKNIDVGIKISAYCQKIDNKKVCVMLNFLYKEFDGWFELDEANSGNLYPVAMTASVNSIILLEVDIPFILNTYFTTMHNKKTMMNFFVITIAKESA